MGFRSKLYAIFRRGRLEAEMAEELQAHLEMQAAENERRGQTPEEARYAAQRAFGGVEQIKERARDVRGVRWLEDFLRDLAFAGRSLRKAPGFTAAVVISLALGIGANTAIFSVVNAVLLRALPYRDPDRLVAVWAFMEDQAQAAYWSHRSLNTAYASVQDWKQQSRLFEDFTAWNWFSSRNVTGIAEPEAVGGWQVSGNFFLVLGVQPMLGRTLLPADESPAADPVVLLSYGFWQRRFGGNPAVLGETILLDDQRHTIVGVMPAAVDRDPFLSEGSDAARVWVPLRQTAEERENRKRRQFFVIGRLKPGVTTGQAREEMNVIAARLQQAYPDANKNWGVRLAPLQEEIVHHLRPTLLVLLGAVSFVLLIACCNVANLLLERGIARRREFAIRVAVGASRLRIVRQSLTETLLLAAAGGAGGLFLAYWGIQLLVAAIPDALYLQRDIPMDGRVLGFALVVSVLSGALAGLVPALRAAQSDAHEALKDGGPGAGVGSAHRRLTGLLVTTEVALVLILLVGAGLMINTLVRLRRIDVGFRASNAMVMRVALAKTRYSAPAPGGRATIAPEAAAIFQQIVERVRGVPGVDGAAAGAYPFLTGFYARQVVTREAQPPLRLEKRVLFEFNFVTPGYFRAIGAAQVRGRDFSTDDVVGAPWVAIVNEAAVEELFGDGDVIGRRIKLEGEEVWREIVGVVGNMRQFAFAAPLAPQIYFPDVQRASTVRAWMLNLGIYRNLVVRAISGTAVSSLVGPIKAAIAEVNKDVPVTGIKTFEDLVANQTSERQFYLRILVVFAVTALVLGLLGTYGVLAYSVRQRTHEIGVRLAFGAQPRDIVRWVIREGMGMVLLGVAVGLAGTLVATQVLAALLYEISATDPLTVGIVILVLLSVAVLACYIPARRAARVDPVEVLRCE